MRALRVALAFSLAAILAACAGDSPAGTPLATAPEGLPLDTTPELDRGGSALNVAQPQATPTAQGAPGNRAILVWWPDELYPQADSATENMLIGQFEGFRLTYSSYDLVVRRKRTHGLGGILPTLRTARPVAPAVVPDLTLMRPADMVTAATEGLIFPIEDWVPPDLLSNLLPGARALGEVDGTLYGLPYALTIYHDAYRASLLSGPLLTFDDVLSQEPTYLFPAGASPVSWTALLQYWAAGGRLVDQSGAATLNREPLIAVLNYYAQGVRQGIFGSALLNYTQFSEYWNDFASADIALIAVDTATYLSHKASAQNVGLAPLPTLSGDPITALDGWVWVLTTNDPDHQPQAQAFVSWMMRISQQSAYTEAFGILPSQERALRLWEDEAYATFAQGLIPFGEVISDTQRANSAAVALQESLVAVLEGAPVDSAADAALAKVAQ